MTQRVVSEGAAGFNSRKAGYGAQALEPDYGSIFASSTSMIGMSSFTAYTRWHCVHFRLSGFCRYSSVCLQAGQTRMSSKSLAIMPALYASVALNKEYGCRKKCRFPIAKCPNWHERRFNKRLEAGNGKMGRIRGRLSQAFAGGVIFDVRSHNARPTPRRKQNRR